MKVYTYDRRTRRPNGTHECKAETTGGKLRRPRNSLEVAPPDYPDFVDIFAGYGRWEIDLEATRANALNEVNKVHAAILFRVTGKATQEERDTWSPKAAAARAFLDNTATASQQAMLETEAKSRGATASELASIVKDKAEAFEQLIGVAGSIRANARTAIGTAETVDEIVAAHTVMTSSAAAIQEG